jgi:hypothetical protein
LIASAGPLEVPGAVEAGQDVDGALLPRPPEGDDLGQCGGDAVAGRFDQLARQLAALGSVGFAVGGDHPLVDPPGRLDTLIHREDACDRESPAPAKPT